MKHIKPDCLIFQTNLGKCCGFRPCELTLNPELDMREWFISKSLNDEEL